MCSGISSVNTAFVGAGGAGDAGGAAVANYNSRLKNAPICSFMLSVFLFQWN